MLLIAHAQQPIYSLYIFMRSQTYRLPNAAHIDSGLLFVIVAVVVWCDRCKFKPIGVERLNSDHSIDRLLIRLNRAQNVEAQNYAAILPAHKNASTDMPAYKHKYTKS